MPFVVRSRSIPTNAIGEVFSETIYPEPDRFATNNDPSFSQKILYIGSAHLEAVVSPNRVGNNGAREAKTLEAVLIGKADDLRVTEGQDQIAKYLAGSEGALERCFCKECGTSLGDMATGDVYVIAASALDDDPGIRPTVHIHTASKPGWYQIVDDLKKFEGDYILEK